MGTMTFTLTDGNGTKIEQKYSCTDCSYISTKKHFLDGPSCPLCYSAAEKIGQHKKREGMSALQYRQILEYLSENTSGVGDATIENIREHFESGDSFLSTVKTAYDDANYETITDVSGIGEATAENIALGIAEQQDWEDGMAENTFTF
jgi:ERCC4-type nuclease